MSSPDSLWVAASSFSFGSERERPPNVLSPENPSSGVGTVETNATEGSSSSSEPLWGAPSSEADQWWLMHQFSVGTYADKGVDIEFNGGIETGKNEVPFTHEAVFREFHDHNRHDEDEKKKSLLKEDLSPASYHDAVDKLNFLKGRKNVQDGYRIAGIFIAPKTNIGEFVKNTRARRTKPPSARPEDFQQNCMKEFLQAPIINWSILPCGVGSTDPIVILLPPSSTADFEKYNFAASLLQNTANPPSKGNAIEVNLMGQCLPCRSFPSLFIGSNCPTISWPAAVPVEAHQNDDNTRKNMHRSQKAFHSNFEKTKRKKHKRYVSLGIK